MPDLGWIVIERWEEFQHYRDRDPSWIKLYTRLMRSDSYLELTGDQRAILCGLWLEFASTSAQLRADTRSLTYRLRLRVTSAQLEALNHAGFISFSASKPLALRYQAASAHATGEETEEEKETKKDQEQNLRTGLVEDRSKTTTGTSTSTSVDSDNGHKEPVVEEDELLKRLDSTLRDMPF